MKAGRVLLYHDISDRDGFLRHLDTLAAYPHCRASEILEKKGARLAITFDDGWEDMLWCFPEIRARGLSACLFLTTRLPELRARGHWEGFVRERFPRLSARRRLVPLSWDEIRDLTKEGLEIGAHTHTHARFVAGMDEERELALPRRLIKQHLGMETPLFAYPYGRRRDLAPGIRKRLLAHGYRLGFTGHGWAVSSKTDPLLIPRHPVKEAWHPEELRDILSGRRDLREKASWWVQAVQARMGRGI